MEIFAWVMCPLMTILGVFVIRRAAAVSDVFAVRDQPDFFDKELPTFYVKQSTFDPKDREVRITTFRGIGIGLVIIGVGGLLMMAVSR